MTNVSRGPVNVCCSQGVSGPLTQDLITLGALECEGSNIYYYKFSIVCHVLLIINPPRRCNCIVLLYIVGTDVNVHLHVA